MLTEIDLIRGRQKTVSPIAFDRKEFDRFCQRWQMTELALLGSVLGPEFRPDSDVDVLVAFAPNARRTLFELVQMQDEYAELFGRSVDLVTRRGIEQSLNPDRRRAILDSARTIYAA